MHCTRARTIDLEGFVVDPGAAEWIEFRDHYPRCPDCSREVSRLGSLIGALRLEATGASGHVSDHQLLALCTAPEQLAHEERERIELHLASCAPCRTERAVLERFDFSALAGEAAVPGLLERLLEALRRQVAAPLLTLPRPVLGALLAVLVAAPVLLWWRASSERGSEAPQLARIEPEVETPPAAPGETPRVPGVTPAEERPTALPPTETPRPAAQKPPAPAPAALARRAAENAPPAPAPEAPPVPRSEPTLQIAALVPTEAPVYAAGAIGGDSVRIGGTSRGGAEPPAPQVLAPEHVGRTAHPSPTLYWFLPEATSLSAVVTIVDPNGVEPLLETTLPGPLAAGVHAVPLAKHGVRLSPGVEYQWFVALVVDPARRARDAVSGGGILEAPAAAEVAGTPPARLAHAYAAAGLWYDAFDQLSVWLEAEPDAAILHAHRAALLEQVGLAEAARYERGQASGAE